MAAAAADAAFVNTRAFDRSATFPNENVNSSLYIVDKDNFVVQFAVPVTGPIGARGARGVTMDDCDSRRVIDRTASSNACRGPSLMAALGVGAVAAALSLGLGSGVAQADDTASSASPASSNEGDAGSSATGADLKPAPPAVSSEPEADATPSKHEDAAGDADKPAATMKVSASGGPDTSTHDTGQATDTTPSSEKPADAAEPIVDAVDDPATPLPDVAAKPTAEPVEAVVRESNPQTPDRESSSGHPTVAVAESAPIVHVDQTPQPSDAATESSDESPSAPAVATFRRANVTPEAVAVTTAAVTPMVAAVRATPEPSFAPTTIVGRLLLGVFNLLGLQPVVTNDPAIPVFPQNPIASLVWGVYRELETIFAPPPPHAAPTVPAVVNSITDTVAVGRGPSSVVVSPDGVLSYVANFDAGTVSVIDNATKAVIDTIAVGAAPAALALDSTGARPYTANSNLNTVSVIDTATGKVVQTVAVGGSPSAIAVNPAGTRVYVTNLDDDTVSVLDVATHQVTSVFAVGASPGAIAITPNGGRVYVANYDAGTVSVIDTATNAVVANVAVGGSPAALAASPDSRRVYVADYQGGSVAAISTATNTVANDSPIYVGGFPDAIAVSPDSSRVYVANFADDTLSVIDAATLTVVVALRTGNGPSAIALSPGGDTAYVADAIDGAVSVVDTSPIATVPVTAEPIPVGRQGTEGFTVYNLTGKPITFVGYWKGDTRPENGGPGIGTVIPPGGSMRFEALFKWFGSTNTYPQFKDEGGVTYDVSLYVGAVRQTRSSCSVGGSRQKQCKIGSEIPGDEKLIYMLDAPGTTATIVDAQEQAQFLDALCREKSLGTCTFKTTRQVAAETSPHYVGGRVTNPVNAPAPVTTTVIVTDAVTNTDSVTVTSKVSIAFLDKLVNAELTQAYGHTWTQTHTFSQSIGVSVPPGYRSGVEATQPLSRAYGDFTITFGNTTLTLKDVYFDTPNPAGVSDYHVIYEQLPTDPS